MSSGERIAGRGGEEGEGGPCPIRDVNIYRKLMHMHANGHPRACLPLYQALVTCMRTAHLSPVTQKKTSVIATRVQNLYKK